MSTSTCLGTCSFVGLGKYLWKGFWRSVHFSLSCGVTVKVSRTVNFLTGYFGLLLMRRVCWYWSLWVRPLQCRAESTGKRKQEGWLPPRTRIFPSWTSAHVVMPQMLGLASVCFHEGKAKTTAIQEMNAGANTHLHIDTPFLSVLLYFFLFILYT